eukprot:EG_transcript_3089
MSADTVCIVLSNVVDKAEEEDLVEWLGDFEGRLEQAALPTVWYLHLPAGADVDALLSLDGTDLGGQAVGVRRATVAELRALRDEEDDGEAPGQDGSASREGSEGIYMEDEPIDVEGLDADDLDVGVGVPKVSGTQLTNLSTMSVDVLGAAQESAASPADPFGLQLQSIPVNPSPVSPLTVSNGDELSVVGSSCGVVESKEPAAVGAADDAASELRSNVARVGSPDSARFRQDDNDVASLTGTGDAASSRASGKRPRHLLDEDDSSRSSKRRTPRQRTSPGDSDLVQATPIKRLSQLPVPRLPATPIARRSGTSDREWTFKLEQVLIEQRRKAEVAFAQFNSWRTVAEAELKSQQAYANKQAARATALEAEAQQLRADLTEAKAAATTSVQDLEAQCEKHIKALLTLREEMATAQTAAVEARGKLLDRLHTAEAEAERRQAVVADLERRLAEKPLVSEETLDLRDQVAQLEKENAALKHAAAHEQESAETIAQLKRELRGLLNVDTALQRAQRELKHAQAEGERAKALEADLLAKGEKVAQLETTLQQWRAAFRTNDPQAAAAASGADRLAALEAELGEAKAEAARMTQQRDLLEVEIGRLEGLVGKGSYDPSTTKVLHCAVPPLAQGRIDALEAEVAALRAGTSDAMTASLKAELEAVKARLAQEERRQQRLLKEFQKQTVQYRDSVYLLTGWKVHRTQDEGLFRLTSCFLPQEDRCLVFQPARPAKGHGAGGFELQAGPLALSLKELQGRLKEEHGVPLFLAEAQLKLRRQHS